VFYNGTLSPEVFSCDADPCYGLVITVTVSRSETYLTAALGTYSDKKHENAVRIVVDAARACGTCVGADLTSDLSRSDAATAKRASCSNHLDIWWRCCYTRAFCER
jgi:hypothetical protein